MQKCQELHDKYRKENKIVHAYLEPREDDADTIEEAISWFKSICKTKDLISYASLFDDNENHPYIGIEPFNSFYLFFDFSHYNETFLAGYTSFCYIEKGTIDFDTVKKGEIFPVILHKHNEDIYTVAVVYKGSRCRDTVYIFYPNKEGLAAFSVFMKKYHPDDKF